MKTVLENHIRKPKKYLSNTFGRNGSTRTPDPKKTTRPEPNTKINGSELGRHETDPNPSDTNPTQIVSFNYEPLISIISYLKEKDK